MTMTDENQGAFDFNPNPPAAKSGATIEEKFQEFHAMNPWVLEELVRMTRELVAQGHTRVGMKMLFEVLRYSWMIRNVNSNDREWRLCNSYTAYYARLVMATNPDLDGVFETRTLRSQN